MSDIPDPTALKKVEKKIEKEAKAEEKHVQQVLKDLHSTEKSDANVTKVCPCSFSAYCILLFVVF